MATTLKGGILDPVVYGEKPLVRNAKVRDIPHEGPNATGFNLQFNFTPPGEDINMQEFAEDVERISHLEPTGPILK